LKEFKEYKVSETPIIISAENYTIVQIKKNLDVYLAGNLPETASQPNWDGTIEKAPAPQAPAETNNQQEQPQQVPPGKANGKEQPSGEQDYGPPPSPQEMGDKSGKK